MATTAADRGGGLQRPRRPAARELCAAAVAGAAAATARSAWPWLALADPPATCARTETAPKHKAARLRGSDDGRAMEHWWHSRLRCSACPAARRSMRSSNGPCVRQTKGQGEEGRGGGCGKDVEGRDGALELAECTGAITTHARGGRRVREPNARFPSPHPAQVKRSANASSFAACRPRRGQASRRPEAMPALPQERAGMRQLDARKLGVIVVLVEAGRGAPSQRAGRGARVGTAELARSHARAQSGGAGATATARGREHVLLTPGACACTHRCACSLR